MNISSIHARQILDSRGNPTVEADVVLKDGSFGRASVPSGASTGVNEAVELRDGGKKYLGKGVTKAVENINKRINPVLVGTDAFDQEKVDRTMITLDGSPNKSKLGANAILAVSLATAHAAAKSQNIPLFKYFAQTAQLDTKKFRLPLPMMNIVNGGKHGDWGTDIQEYVIIPKGAKSFSEALRMGSEVFHTLGKILQKKGYFKAIGDEGGYALVFKNGNTEPFELISEASESLGYKIGRDILLGIDAAASEFYKNSTYKLKSEKKEFTSKQMNEFWQDLIKKYEISSVEDPLDQDDWDGWVELEKMIGKNAQLIGDDIFVTNTKFLERGIRVKAANSILIKVNQIGTLTETFQAVKMARQAGWNAIISHRSGETEDTTISHLVVGLGTGQIKTGSVSRTDRVAKYNELLRIEEMLGKQAEFSIDEIFKK